MMEVTITINVPGLVELADALNNLAGVKKEPQQEPAVSSPAGLSVPEPQQTQAPEASRVPVSTIPAPQTQPVHPQSPVSAAPVQPAVPTSTVSYTADDLARAAMTLMDAGKQPQLIQLLNSFGVDSLPALPPEQYGAFATALRGMGAQI